MEVIYIEIELSSIFRKTSFAEQATIQLERATDEAKSALRNLRLAKQDISRKECLGEGSAELIQLPHQEFKAGNEPKKASKHPQGSPK